VPRLCEFYPGICLTTEEKAWKNLSQVKKNLSHSTVYILPKHPHKYTLQNAHMHTHITRQYKTTAVQIKTQCKIYPNEIVIILYALYSNTAKDNHKTKVRPENERKQINSKAYA
jgi:transcription initiation factor IIE alpha subunit